MLTATLSGVRADPAPSDFDKIFRDHYQLVYRTAYGVTGNSEDAEDVLQTIFLRLLRRETLPDLNKNPKAYLYRAAVNLSLNTIKQRRRETVTNRPVAQPSESDSLEELHLRLYQAMAELEPEAAQALVLRYVHNYSDAEIARLLGKSRGVIAVRLFRSRARLKRIMNRTMESA